MSCSHTHPFAMSCPNCGSELPKKGMGRTRLTDEERAQRKKESAAKWYRAHAHDPERRAKHYEANKAYYVRNRPEILARLKTRRHAAKEALRLVESQARAAAEGGNEGEGGTAPETASTVVPRLGA